jgi:acyl-CoA synthetase (AMP-forming)/AMP-acid ligase II
MGGKLTVTDQLRLMADEFGGEVAFKDVRRQDHLTFAAWEQRSNRLARGLTANGVGHGDRVAILLPPAESLEWVVSYAAIHKAGAVAVPLNTRLAVPEVHRLLDHAEATGLITTKDQRAEIDDVAAEVVSLRLLTDDITSLMESDPSAYQVDVEPHDLADILYTSGTTGLPKGVAVNHANMSMLRAGRPRWTGRGWLSSSPLFTFAGITPVYSAMRLGLAVLHQPRFDVREWLATVTSERPPMVFLVPAMVELLMAHPDTEAADLSSLTTVLIGSAPLAPQLFQRLRDRLPQAEVTNSYSLTESGSAFFAMSADEAAERVGSIGRPVPPTEVRLVDDADEPVPVGEVGEMWLRVPGRTRHYYQDEESTAATWHRGWLRSGDLARADEEGYLYIVGRKKDVIIRGGNNVHANDVEAVLYEHPAVAEAAVAGVPHPVLGEDVAAWVVLRPDADTTVDDLRAHCAARLADYKTPRSIAVVAELPRNATGKVVKAQLTEAHQPPGDGS